MTYATDTDALVAVVNRDAQQIKQLRRRVAVASLGLITARIHVDHPQARYLQMHYVADEPNREGYTKAERVWIADTEETGRWQACLDAKAREDVAGWCDHLGPDIERLVPEIWCQWTGLTVVSLDAVIELLGGRRSQ